MIRINLNSDLKAPVDIRALYVGLTLLAIVYAICLGIPFFVSLIVDARTELLNLQYTEKSQEIKKLQVDLSQIENLKKSTKTLQSRLETIRNLSKGRKQVVLLLDLLQQQHLDKMWIRDLTLSRDSNAQSASKGPKIAISGTALDHLIVAEYVKRLKSVDDSSQQTTSEFRFSEPKFEQPSDSKSATRVTDEIIPMKFKDVTLISSESTQVGKYTAQNFALEFEPTLP